MKIRGLLIVEWEEENGPAGDLWEKLFHSMVSEPDAIHKHGLALGRPTHEQITDFVEAGTTHLIIPEEIIRHQCDNCKQRYTDVRLGREGKLGLHSIPKLTERLDPGGVVPTGECRCGALTYLLERED